MDEVVAETEAGPWVTLCESCGRFEQGFTPTELILGYYRTEAEAKAAIAKHLEEADVR